MPAKDDGYMWALPSATSAALRPAEPMGTASASRPANLATSGAKRGCTGGDAANLSGPASSAFASRRGRGSATPATVLAASRDPSGRTTPVHVAPASGRCTTPSTGTSPTTRPMSTHQSRRAASPSGSTKFFVPSRGSTYHVRSAAASAFAPSSDTIESPGNSRRRPSQMSASARRSASVTGPWPPAFSVVSRPCAARMATMASPARSARSTATASSRSSGRSSSAAATASAASPRSRSPAATTSATPARRRASSSSAARTRP
mmetsp:Transcript_20950/g.67697  ORF Transcript_20950/g.67697 Transcript_20950/m.67697 type:complete len:263 (+) Transcript_20950:229-1017(+)